MPSHHALAQEADAMKRYAITLTRDVHIADDLVQDCMERALRKWTLRREGVPLRHTPRPRGESPVCGAARWTRETSREGTT